MTHESRATKVLTRAARNWQSQFFPGKNLRKRAFRG